MSFVDVLLPVALDQPYSYRSLSGMSLQEGDIVRVPFGAREAIGVVWSISDIPPKFKKIKNVIERIDIPSFSKNLCQFIDWMAWYTLAPKGQILSLSLKVPEKGREEAAQIGLRFSGYYPERLTHARKRVLEEIEFSDKTYTKKALAQISGVSFSVLDGLIDAGTLETVPLPPQKYFEKPDISFFQPALSPEQKEAAICLCESVRNRNIQPVLLHGVTGSGKTEVYFEALAETLAQGRQALILMPEIALTTQFLERFKQRFGCVPPTWHSNIPERRRERLYHALSSGEVSVIAGARSALFLPYKDLGLIIVDEEHEPTYKQEDNVIYQARDMAIMRARFEKAAIILASATPSLETQINVEKGRYRYCRLPERFGGRKLPRIEAVDMRKDAPPQGHWLSQKLINAAQKTLQKGEQVLFYLNRRGYAPLTLCRSCGHRYECPRCSSTLVEHKFRKALMCHLCGHLEPKPNFCIECGTTDSLITCGPGVERIAEEVSEFFPNSRKIILSSDRFGNVDKFSQELHDIEEGNYSIIIGTQLVAKGYHFPKLTLVGVIDADVSMTSGDPRASERTFQLLQQVSGRSGRGEVVGNALLQTWQPQHTVLKSLISGDEKEFYEQEKAVRELAHMPPFGRLAAFIISGRDKTQTELAARTFVRLAPQHNAIDILGPVEAPIIQIRGRFRYRILVKAPRGFNLQNYIRYWMSLMPKKGNAVRITIDIDPYTFV